MKIKSLIKHNLMRAAMTLALILACATAWAQDAEFTLDTPPPFYFTGNQIRPSVRLVTIGDTEYDESRFTVTYGRNIDSGENSCVIYVTITAESDYQGYVLTKMYPIEKRLMTVNIHNCEKHYGADDPAFTWQLVWDEAVQQDTINNLRNYQLPKRLNGHLTRTAGEAMGDYAISYEGTNPIEFANYLVTVNPGTLTITAPNPDDFSVNADGTEYTIHTATGWNFFCEALQDNETYNHFSGKTVKLGANITVTQMAGGSNHAFKGTFDGNHKTLTLNYGTAQAPIDAEFVAPFVEVSGGAEFIDLNIDGHIYAAYTGSSEPGVGGPIGHLFGSITIKGCTSTVEINSTKDRVGGFVGLCEHAVTFTNCKSSAVVTCTGSGSGFVGWSRASNYTIAF